MSDYEMEKSLEEISKLIKKEASGIRGACERVVIREAKKALESDIEHDKVVSKRIESLERALRGLSGMAIQPPTGICAN